MYLSTEQAKKILRNCNLEFGGVHKVHGWDHYIAVYRLDHRKITFKVKSANPRKTTLTNGIIKALQERFGSIRIQFNESWSGYVSGTHVVDPSGVMPLAEKYLMKQYTHIDRKTA